jgi:hypothetical protein
VVSVTGNSFVVSTIWGNKSFDATTICFGVLPGDSVVFAESAGVCVSNKFGNLRSGQMCEVWCR